MEHHEYNGKTTDVRTATLMERLHSYFEDANMQAHHAEEQLIPLHKFHTLMLTAEIYEYIRIYAINREDNLSEYFSGMTLKRCLENVVEIEKMQESVGDIHQNFYFYDMRVNIGNNVDADDLQNYGLGANARYEGYYRLHESGIVGYYDKTAEVRPSIDKSLLWKAEDDNDFHYKFGRLFAKAKEPLDENVAGIHSKDPEIRAYSNELHKKELSRQIAHKVKRIGAHDDMSESASVFDVLHYIIDIQKKAEEAPADVIVRELLKAMELLRNVFMTQAEDIYYIRTGDFAGLRTVYEEDVIQKYYSEIPFTKYNKQRDDFRQQLHEDIEIDLANWRCAKDYTGRKLKKEEYEEFLNERKDHVIADMKKYENLWELRKHSGGLDAGVTPENFARMFYRRDGVDKYFIELQWELEEVSRMISENKEITVIPEQTPEQRAVSDFVDKIISVAINAYDKWNNKYVSPGVNKPDVFVVIKKEELIGFIQSEQKNHFEDLCELCYPATSSSKQYFCRYVMRLQKEDYFGALPNKLLAEVLAPIVELSPGTTNNYLSKL